MTMRCESENHGSAFLARVPQKGNAPAGPWRCVRPSVRGVALAALMVLAGCGEPSVEAGRTVMAEGPEADIPALTREVTALHLRNVGADRVYALHPPEGLRELSLIGNGLMTLPDDLVPRGIVRLWLADNRLTHLPRGAEGWERLEYLNLDRNLFAALPDLSRTRLRWLRLNGNRLTASPPLPDTVERLYLADNRLPEAPPKPVALRHLMLAGNPIATVPDDLGAGLEWLDLSRTDLAALPRDLAPWRTLKVLNLSHCPLPEAEKDRITAAFDPYETVVLF